MDGQKNNILEAERLKRVNERTRQVDNIMSDIIRRINCDLRNAQREGSHHIVVELPVKLEIIHMTLADAQIEIYGNVINFLEEKGYKVAFRANPAAVKISWRNDDEERRRKENFERIMRCKKNF